MSFLCTFYILIHTSYNWIQSGRVVEQVNPVLESADVEDLEDMLSGKMSWAAAEWEEKGCYYKHTPQKYLLQMFVEDTSSIIPNPLSTREKI